MITQNGWNLHIRDWRRAAHLVLLRVHDVATLVLGGPEDVQPYDSALYEEVAGHLTRLGYDASDAEAALAEWAGVVNLENRIVPGGIDSRVLAELRRA